MNILFAISVAAFCALMWASIAIARHIRLARRRREDARDAPSAAPLPPLSPEIVRAAEALAAGSWGGNARRNSRPDWKAAEAAPSAPPVTIPAPEPAAETPAPAAIEVSTPDPIAPTPPPPMPPPAIRFPLSSQRRASSAAVATAAEAVPAPPPAAPLSETRSDAAPSSTPGPKSNSGFQLRRPPVPSSDSRPDWAYFNKDMGDLSDPEPRFRERTRQR